MFRTLTAAALVALSFTTLGTAAQAGEVRFGDLNLASPADARILDGRIAADAAESCAVKLDFGVSASLIYQAGREQKACIARVSAQTLAKIQALASARVPTATRLARQ